MFWLFYPETLLLLLPALILAGYASYKVRSTYAKYLQVPTQKRVTAAQVADLRSAAGKSGHKAAP